MMTANEIGNKLRDLRGKTPAIEVAEAIGISRSAWFRKVNGNSEFTQGEIKILRQELCLDDHQTSDIFFSEEVP